MDGLDKEHQAEVDRLLAKMERLEKEKLKKARKRFQGKCQTFYSGSFLERLRYNVTFTETSKASLFG